MTAPAAAAEPAPSEFLKPPAVARRLLCTPQIVRSWARDGCKVNGQVVKLRCEFAGTRYLIRPEWVEDFKRDCARARGQDAGPTMPPPHDPDAAERRTREVLADVESW